ncbi:LANO_0H19020g1_1 [Lachancea nothofagi CBS 11611]|uniref:LANO_0H19020g1_1 n=1 Tax=Lachancea nothofagi CBS 11611 TaxID=1266666 RepID=A0A1G4KNB2_9SACH|nr:LANO_0H19020g1_1 [Lachancea nothofagi CBS 11611]
MRFYLVWLLLTAVCMADSSYINCFASLPSSFSFNNTAQWQTSSLCYATCKATSSKYFALKNGGDCYCGNSNPSDSESTSSSCTTVCNGYGDQMCGGSDAFSVYAIEENLGNSASSSAGPSSSGASSSSPSSSKSSSSSSSSSPSSSASGSSSSPASTSTTSSSSSSTTSAPTSSSPSSSSSSSDSNNNVVTSTQTSGGSVNLVTQTVTASSPASTESQSSQNKSDKKPKNLGAIIGGVVGGVCGAALIAGAILLGLRRINKQREQERMEKEYQEAIKPVDFDDTLYQSSASTRKAANPFDDTRRISMGSVMEQPGVPDQNALKTLTVANPDE